MTHRDGIWQGRSGLGVRLVVAELTSRRILRLGPPGGRCAWPADRLCGRVGQPGCPVRRAGVFIDGRRSRRERSSRSRVHELLDQRRKSRISLSSPADSVRRISRPVGPRRATRPPGRAGCTYRMLEAAASPRCPDLEMPTPVGGALRHELPSRSRDDGSASLACGAHRIASSAPSARRRRPRGRPRRPRSRRARHARPPLPTAAGPSPARRTGDLPGQPRPP